MLLGGFRQTSLAEFGSSEYAKVVLGRLWGVPPSLDMDYERRVHECMRKIAAEGLVESAHDLSDGGLAVALSESCTDEIGARVTLRAGERPEFALFGEAQSRILVTTADPVQIQAIATRHGVESPVIGDTMKVLDYKSERRPAS